MNIFDFLFENSFSLEKDLILGPRESKSFKSISEESVKLANYLRNKLGQDNKILLVAQNSSFFIVSYLGILKSGNICVPLNPAIEKEGFEFIQKKTNSRIGFLSEVVKNKLQPDLECISDINISEIINYESCLLYT